MSFNSARRLLETIIEVNYWTVRLSFADNLYF